MRASVRDPHAWAWFNGRLATDLVDVTSDPDALDGSGFWAAAVTFEGEATFARFARVRPSDPPRGGAWLGPQTEDWRSSLSREDYVARVGRIRDLIATGEVYQVNLCRVLTAPLRHGAPDLAALHRALRSGNPAPYAGVVDLPRRGVRIVSASPELFLGRHDDVVTSGPIKGTGRNPDDLRTKDVAENVMITDLVRNDLGRVARTGTVTVPDLCQVEHHPGLVHLVSRVRCELRPGVGWRALLAATMPPGSVSGAPKSSALSAIRDLEPIPRGFYCGTVGWVADRTSAALAVGIRSFSVVPPGATERPTGPYATLRLGTGAGIVWDSDPQGEWQETVLKAQRLLGIAGGHSERTTRASA